MTLVRLEKRWLIKLHQGSFSLPCYLGLFINTQAKATVPFPISTSMRLCLSLLVHWFYMNPESIMLVHVDPDISQLFGEVWPGAILESKIELTVISGF